MRLVTFTHSGSTRIGTLKNAAIADLTVSGLPSTMIDLLTGSSEALERAREAAANR
jgi:hypothetical protein